MITLTSANLDIDAANELLRSEDAPAIIQWAADLFGDRLVMTSSFGAESAVMLHLATRVVPNIPVILVDTGYLFGETYLFIQKLTDRLHLNLKVYQSPISPARMEATNGRLWEKGTQEALNLYDRVRKVEPMQRALDEVGAHAWLAGLRRTQTKFRSALRFVEAQGDVAKIHPVLNWTTRDMHAYLKNHDLPYHPLYEKGYTSIGDWHTTAPVTAGMGDREGRFHGLKQECGLHLPQTQAESQSRESSGL